MVYKRGRAICGIVCRRYRRPGAVFQMYLLHFRPHSTIPALLFGARNRSLVVSYEDKTTSMTKTFAPLGNKTALVCIQSLFATLRGKCKVLERFPLCLRATFQELEICFLAKRRGLDASLIVNFLANSFSTASDATTRSI